MQFIVVAVMVYARAGLDAPTTIDPLKDFPQKQMTRYEECKAELNITTTYEDDKQRCIPRCELPKLGKILESGEPVLNNYVFDLRDNVTACYEKVKNKDACEREISMEFCIGLANYDLRNRVTEICERETNTDYTKIMTNLSNHISNVRTGLCQYRFEELSCYNRCKMLKLGKINEDDEIVKEHFLDDEEVTVDADVAIKECSKDDDKIDDKCKEAMRKTECLQKKFLPTLC